jgi:hypothetical protein
MPYESRSDDMSEPEEKAPETTEDIEVVAHSAEVEEEPASCIIINVELD